MRCGGPSATRRALATMNATCFDNDGRTTVNLASNLVRTAREHADRVALRLGDTTTT
jgi:hypothetical protein